LQSRLKEDGADTELFKNNMPHQWFMCLWTSKKHRKLRKCVKQYDAVIALGRQSATETVRDVVVSNDWRAVIEGMEFAGIMNGQLRFHWQGNVSFDTCKIAPISQQEKE